ncbi:MAG: ion channel, partial [Candidatus Acidiferrales bacterium]
PVNLDQLSAKITYFSFATLTTIGSEITPIDPFARSMTTAEAIVGQLFPAILIGALVAMAMQPRGNS